MISAISDNRSLHQGMTPKKFAKIDSSADGQVDAQELAAHRSGQVQGGTADKIMKKADLDGNGQLSQDELTGFAESQKAASNPTEKEKTESIARGQDADRTLAEMMKKRFAKLDTNGDGQADAAEIAARQNAKGNGAESVEKILAKSDLDGDGVLSETENNERIRNAPPKDPSRSISA